MGVFCDRLNLCSTAAPNCRTSQNKGRYRKQELSFLLVLLVEVAFFQKVRFVFQISKSPKKLLQITILSLSLKLNKLFTVMGGNFKFQVQDSDLE